MENASGKNIMENIAKVIVGKQKAVKLILVALFSEGHILLEDLPGSGKTLLTKTLAKSINGKFKRIQFTPDLLPGDITGFNIYDSSKNEFVFRSGPVMANIVLADEINRAIPRTQSSLLESMEEKQVTVDSKTHKLPNPFMVMATQNPIELEGTFPLPEAQLDRFLLKISLGYPDKGEEDKILRRFGGDDPLVQLEPVSGPEEILEIQKHRKEITVSDPVRKYIIDIVERTRNNKKIKYGASPRGSLGLMKASQSLAVIEGRNYVLPDDVKELAVSVLAHRVVLSEKSLLTGVAPESVIAEILEETPVAAGQDKGRG